MLSKEGGSSNPTIQEQVRTFLHATYPSMWELHDIVKHLGLQDNYDAVAKGCSRLLDAGQIQRPSRAKWGLYQGIATPQNVGGLEDPPVKIHCLTFHMELKNFQFDKIRGCPTVLYSTLTRIKNAGKPKKYNKHSQKEWHQIIDYWHCDNHLYKVVFQFHEKSVSIHIHASKKPLDETNFLTMKAWVYGMLQAYGVNTDLTETKIVKAEFNKDYTLISITPRELLIRDLENNSYLRSYRKYRNLHRLEIGTTWEGDKKLYEMFEEFGKAKETAKTPFMNDVGGMFG